MGKPSSSRLSTKSLNNVSESRKKVSAAMNTHKGTKNKRKTRRRINRSIKNLFERLRSDSDMSLNSTVISLDNSVQTTNKRKLSTDDDGNDNAKKRKSNSNLIVINDDDDVNTTLCPNVSTPKKNIQSSPICCSTPFNKNTPPIGSPKINNNSNSIQNFNEDVINVTREINKDSYLTIDLTTDTERDKTNSKFDTVIDLVNTTDTQDCTLVSISNASLSISGESDVTVLHKPNKSKEKQMRKFANGIANLNASEKGRLLELITQNIFSGCNISKNKLVNLQKSLTRVPESSEDAYIKEVILGQSHSRNSIGSNIYNPERGTKKTGLRMIVIDGSNVAMQHGKHKVFSVKGLKICIDYFLKRGHVVKAFVPRFRCKFGKSTQPRLLDEMERRGVVIYTPSREIQGKTIASYDDRYIVQCAAEFDGVIVSGDNYRDLLQENPRWRFVIENRLLPFTWVEDMIMFPKDPLGRNGPTLEQFLRHPPNKIPNVIL